MSSPSEGIGTGTENQRPTPNIRPNHRIADTLYSQQKLPAWQPIINFGTVWLPLVVIGVLFIVSGLVFLFLNSQPNEIRISYASPDVTECKNCINQVKVKRGPCQACSSSLSAVNADCQCSVPFDVDEELKLPVFMYYEIENFHQNHRRYVKSRDDYQLLGKIGTSDKPTQPSSLCAPFAYDSKSNKIYFPCGAIANSMFSDSFKIKQNENNVKISDATSWESERRNKFRNPVGVHNLEDFMKKYSASFVKPKDWSEEFWKEWWSNKGLQNEKFINWMHPAVNPTFRKLYGTIESVPGCSKKGVLCKGKYDLSITYRFDVDRFKGKKHVILARTSFLGSKNKFIGWFTIVVGLISFLIGAVFFFLNKRHKSRVHPSQRRFSLNDNQGGQDQGPLTPLAPEPEVVLIQPALSSQVQSRHGINPKKDK